MKIIEGFSSRMILIFMIGITIIEGIVVYFLDLYFWSFAFIIVFNVLITLFIIYQKRHYVLNRELLIQEINENAETALTNALSDMPLGVIRYNPETFDPEWYNPYVELIFQSEDIALTASLLEKVVVENEKGENNSFDLADRKYAVVLDAERNLLYLTDATTEFSTKIALSKGRPAIGAISVDNYGDVTEGLSESEISNINNFVIQFLENFAEKNRIYLRRSSSDRFIFFTNYKVLSELMIDKFSLLEDFREESLAHGRGLTLSMGISYGTNNFSTIGRTSVNNLELALVRGGDQAVIRENVDQAHVVYFGGNSVSQSERSRTRARAIATALKTIISEADQVFMVGHRFMDMDALGAAIAMKNFATVAEKEAFVVYRPEELSTDVKRAINQLNAEDKSLYEHIIYLSTAKKIKRENALLIMVDHSKISQTLDQEFYESFQKIVVIDHHRRDEDYPKQALLSYIESGASSASEMAVEVLQFQNSKQVKMTSIEASVILAGISVDTKSFRKSTTAKTFEAASYLRSQGASNEVIADLLAVDFESYKRVNQIVVHAEFLGEHIAIATGKAGLMYEKITLAKAANQLLELDSIDISFVLAESKTGTVLVSARSRGGVNVQKIMEELGGGGHFDAAATEIMDATVAEVKEKLIEIVQTSE